MIPAQLIRALGQACRLAGIEAAHVEALAVGDDAPLDVAHDLVDQLLAALEERMPRPSRPSASEDAPTHRSARMGRHIPRVRELAAAGRSDAQIAAALGSTVPAVRAIRRRYAIPAGVAPGGVALRTGWEVRIREAWERGLTTSQIAEATGYTVRTVQQRLAELRLAAHRIPAPLCSAEAHVWSDAACTACGLVRRIVSIGDRQTLVYSRDNP